MADNSASDSGPDSIDVARLGRLADCLLALGESYATIAKHLQNQGVSVIEGAGMPTAERGARYLANFTSNVLVGYQQACLDGTLKERAPDAALAKALSAEALARNVAEGGKKRKPSK